ncbi:HAMP domain-containing sensor histidine kinase [Roseiarcaceae bacterium H3SJ34-1]|uniref:sensor histidine kinase n=1 Tax=Terripilifer ovatus TaxID=3032367 RepID=UPI003AB95182|nr:HAMP domain-containing sensor histidine kinase [Roseiarcaceae bacterium H3SJ34-1]
MSVAATAATTSASSSGLHAAIGDTCGICAMPLRSRLVHSLVKLQGIMLTMLGLLLVATLWTTGVIPHQRDEEAVVKVVSDAIFRDGNGDLALRSTPMLERLRAADPPPWLLVRDGTGHILKEGPVPPLYERLAGSLDDLGQAKFGWDRRPAKDDDRGAVMKRLETAAGEVQIITTTEAKLSHWKAIGWIALSFGLLTVPSLILMTLATLIATPIVVRRALSGLDELARHASQINIDKRGSRLPVDGVPLEVEPLVSAVNEALGRLDKGYDRQGRFLADAAHELRTPIAILATRLESLPPSEEQTRLIEDVARLANLTEQLLDKERLEHQRYVMQPVDLAEICARVAADLAPIAIAGGYEISFHKDADSVMAWGDRSALERALVNLVQNAIQHGGRRGAIDIAARLPAVMEVCDEGPGICSDEREQIFEPLYRVRPQSQGAGLGLHLVREIIRMHKGDVSVTNRAPNGACFKISLPVA